MGVKNLEAEPDLEIRTEADHVGPADQPSLTTPPLLSRSFGPMPVRGNLRGHLARGLARLLILLAGDLFAVFLGWWWVQQLRRGLFGEWGARFIGEFLPLGAISGTQFAVALVLAMAMVGGYRKGDQWRDPTRTLSGVGLAVILSFYSDLWHGEAQVVALRALVVWCLLGLTIVLVRGLERILRDKIPTPRFIHRVLEIRGLGSPERPLDLGPDYRTTAVLAADDLSEDLEDMGDWLDGGVDTLLLSGQLSPEAFGHVTDFALTHGCRLLCVPHTQAMAGVETRPLWLKGTPFMELTAPGLRASQLMVKRALDVVGSLVLLAVLSPVLAALAVWVRLDSPGPVFFRQWRPGFRGRWFPMVKFRSMRVDAEEVLRADADLYESFLQNDCKLPEDQDPRITSSGRFLRRTSLDELPQLLNVLRGEMSLVGPRPLVGPELENYAGKVPALLSVKPGMTGTWQVSGRSSIAFPERAQLDLDYVRSWSLMRDLWILAITPPAVVLQRGAH